MLGWLLSAADRDRLDDAAAEFEKVVNDDQLSDAAFLILANKQDAPNAIQTSELEERLGIRRLCEHKKWSIYPTTLTTGEGVTESFSWLADNMVAL